MDIFKKLILTEVDKIAQLKKISITSNDKCPWFDLELHKFKNARNTLSGKLRSDKTGNSVPNIVIQDDNIITDPVEIVST